MKSHTYTTTYACCTDCGGMLQECQDDEDEARYYECIDCGVELDLDGSKRKKG